MPNIIKSIDNSFEFTHNSDRCGGPHLISCDGKPLLTMLDCSVNGISDSDLRVKSSRLYHKAGQTIFESKGSYPCGVAMNQVCRYAGNAVRITWDINWPKETRPIKSVQIGSAKLHGNWTGLTTIARDGSSQSFELRRGLLIVPGKPISLLLSREDGAAFEYSLGFDLWRWDHAMGLPVDAPFILDIAEDKTTLVHNVCDPTPEEVFPEAREYRFMAVIAFSTPSMTKPPSIEEPVTVPFRRGKEDLNLDGISSTALRIDYKEMPCIENGKLLSTNGRHGICLEDDHSMSAVKRTIRQLAGFAQTGSVVLDGLTPGHCIDGSHCAKKQPREHCDLYSLLTLLAWAKNCLGQGWTVVAPQPAPWNALPSLAFSHMPLDFEY